LQLVLPELLLPRLVEEGKVADMVNEYVSKYGKLRFLWRYLAALRSKRCAEPLERRWGVEFVDLPLDLLGHQLALQVWPKDNMSARDPSSGAF